jgi:C-terminal processing protease CtpA/Prc
MRRILVQDVRRVPSDGTFVPLGRLRRAVLVAGLGVFDPDGRPTQRVGIEPDVVAEPTIAGLQSGADEVLDVALALLER